MQNLLALFPVGTALNYEPSVAHEN